MRTLLHIVIIFRNAVPYAAAFAPQPKGRRVDSPIIARYVEAVSYTHLDVYKRQSGDRVPPPERRTPLHNPRRRLLDVYKRQGRRVACKIIKDLPLTHALLHLVDVYKRQAVPRIVGRVLRIYRLCSGFFEKKPRQKTLAGCAANSGLGTAFIQAAPRIVGQPQ